LDDTEERDALAGLASSVQEACEGTEVSFTLGKGDFDGSVLWNFGDGNFSNETRPTHVFESPGTYDITISLRSRDNGMIRTKTVENMIVVRPKPDAELNWTATLDPSGDGLLVKYVDETVGSSSSTWLVDGHGLERGEQHFHRSGQHAVHLVASNAYGCQDSQERIVEVGGRHEAKAPGLFSPNGDGRYDVFLPGIVSEVYGDWKLEIFDEKGQVVFETSDETRPWDGGLNAGRKASPGAEFKWILSVYHKHSLPTFFFDTVRIER
jgi:gliding motility-associated-like protein